MATDDRQVLVTGREDTPAHFRIPGNGQLRPKAVTAHYDGSGAGDDFLAALKITSDAGELVGVYPISTVIAAGASARVSWFPRVGTGGGGVTGVAAGFFWGWTTTGQVIPSGVVTPLTFSAWTSAPGVFPPIAFDSGTGGDFTVVAWRVHVDLTVTFPAGAYDRYVEIAQVGQAANEPLFSPIRARSQVTPDGDSLTVSGFVVGNPFSPSPLQLNVFQASGVNQTVSRFTSMYGLPIPLPSLSWN